MDFNGLLLDFYWTFDISISFEYPLIICTPLNRRFSNTLEESQKNKNKKKKKKKKKKASSAHGGRWLAQTNYDALMTHHATENTYWCSQCQGCVSLIYKPTAKLHLIYLNFFLY